MLLIFLSQMALAELLQLSLEMSKKDLRVFEVTIGESARKGYLDQSSNPWRRGFLRQEKKNHSVKFKLKGDLPKHWTKAQKSWAFKLPSSSLDGVSEFSLTIAADKYFALPLLVQKIYSEYQLATPASQLLQLRTFPYPQFGLYVLEEDLSESFREKNHLAYGDFYVPNNQWVIGLRNKAHPYASHFAQAKKNYHPFLSDCIFYRPKLHTMMADKFCQFLSQLKHDPQLAFERTVEKKPFLQWMAVMTYLSDSHSALVDNHAWYYNFLSEMASIMPRDFIPNYPAFSTLEAYQENLKLRHPLMRVILEDKVLNAQYLEILRKLLLSSKKDIQFLKDKTPWLKLEQTEKRDWSDSLKQLEQWHQILLVTLSKAATQ